MQTIPNSPKPSIWALQSCWVHRGKSLHTWEVPFDWLLFWIVWCSACISWHDMVNPGFHRCSEYQSIYSPLKIVLSQWHSKTIFLLFLNQSILCYTIPCFQANSEYLIHLGHWCFWIKMHWVQYLCRLWHHCSALWLGHTLMSNFWILIGPK